MKVLGIETSCDECAASVVVDGNRILSNTVATQIDFHRPYHGVVPEIASRKHVEWIVPVVKQALAEAGLAAADLDGVAVTSRPGLIGSLLVGFSFARAFAYGLGIPCVGINHILAHLHAAHVGRDIPYPYLGLVVSGGHTLIARVETYDDLEVLGTTIDDAIGEAFDKVARHYGFGYPGGLVIDRLAQEGNEDAFRFSHPNLYKGDHPYDVSYSGLKTAAINQLDQFRNGASEASPSNIAASFQKAAVNILLSRVRKAMEDTGLRRIVVGGGVAANSRLRKTLAAWMDAEVFMPPVELCTDNAVMIAALGYRYLADGRTMTDDENATSREYGFKKRYP